ncbi:DUF3326 domain-containing protein [bacterium]|nr:DUF3326 domain-containing protein [bacterium]
MLKSGEKFGAFIVPTGVGASVGGFAGDASGYARKFAKISKLLVNPNVINAGGFSGITDNMFYVEGYSLDEFFKGNLKLIPSESNKIGIVFDKSIPNDVLNVHINTMNAVKCVYGLNISGYEVTEDEVGVEFNLDNCGISTGTVKNPETLLKSSKKLIQKGCDAIALVCLFDDAEGDNPDYAKGEGVDPVGGVEAVLSHYISKELKVPCAHSPAFRDYQIYPDLVDIKSASEYITPTFLPCILLGLSIAPKLSQKEGISIDELDYLVMPYDSPGSTPVFEALKRGKKVFAIKENSTVLNVSPEKISPDIIICETYEDCLQLIFK